MAGAFITVDTRGFKEYDAYLERIVRRAGSALPAFELAGIVIAASVRKNFDAQGRPQKWQPLSAATMASKNKRGTKILINRGMAGGLMGSINADPSNTEVRVGTDKPYGAIHQFGGKTKPHVIVPKHAKALSTPYGIFKKVNHPGSVIPARPYLVIQDEDWTAIKAAFERYLTED